MSQEKLGRILSSVAMRMRADFEQSRNFSHNGEAGTSREALVREFLASYLPSHVETIHNAEIITASGETSPQCDIVLADRGTPPFTTLNGYRILPNECVYGVVEVKTKLDKEQLLDACNKISKLRHMSKDAYRPTPGLIPRKTSAYGKVYDFFPTSGIIIAFDSLKLETIGSHLMDWCQNRPPVEWPDSVWVLGKGHLQWQNPGNHLLERSPEPGSLLTQIDTDTSQDILLALALHLNIHFSDAWMNPIDLVPYAGAARLGVISRRWRMTPTGRPPKMLEGL
ncbi:hypothetical protein FNV65_22410 [Streptomyces sp. S1A1-8]|uniref:DUF6602 domain-containing protein n=1 Tax=unclassified Streptomyces TaxID=2593676 RepID=UPI001163F40B|nr:MULTISPECIES: DUF6602 domain-containing protein [unclassified Streptomyces]QDN98647.1 hypothetical protein FNV58_23920 [Streptomyces sp. RLB1-9]QDO20361.1 hypothetical protein FNV65_22410 [Streptomyces sp. S1A1-8]QDO30487.1 hypothetical protein FNV63_22425 [Streptomyces sp. S1A1-3]